MTTKKLAPTFIPVNTNTSPRMNVGDTARMTEANGDTHTFTVATVDSLSGRIADASGRTYAPNAGTWEVAPRAITLPTKIGVYLPHFYADGSSVPNVWLLTNSGWLELPNATDSVVRRLPLKRVEENLSTMVYLGTGSADQKVVTNV